MDYKTLSPSECAAEVLSEILKTVAHDAEARDRIERLIRQKVRLIFEHCAMLAEDYVADHDLGERLTGMEVGDGIAESIRQLADDRKAERLLTACRISQLD